MQKCARCMCVYDAYGCVFSMQCVWPARPMCMVRMRRTSGWWLVGKIKDLTRCTSTPCRSLASMSVHQKLHRYNARRFLCIAQRLFYARPPLTDASIVHINLFMFAMHTHTHIGAPALAPTRERCIVPGWVAAGPKRLKVYNAKYIPYIYTTRHRNAVKFKVRIWRVVWGWGLFSRPGCGSHTVHTGCESVTMYALRSKENLRSLKQR